MAGGRGRNLSGAEHRLWAHMMGDVTPMRHVPAHAGHIARARARPARRRMAASQKAETRDLAALKREVQMRSPALHKPVTLVSEQPPEDVHIQQMDRRNALRLKRGQMKIQATLDLHGHSQAIAHAELNAFLDEAMVRGNRCILVITGKGPLLSRRSPAEDQGWDEELTTDGFIVERRGVLRRMLPRWLSEPHNRARVIAWHPARGRHGGGGAFYVLLRRNRG